MPMHMENKRVRGLDITVDRGFKLRFFSDKCIRPVLKLGDCNAIMDQTLANKLFEEGAILFVLDVPLGTELGMDLNTWKTGEKFKGIKMIPPGIHYIYYSSIDKHGCVAPRAGFFYNFQKKDIVVLKWNAETEEILDLCTDSEKETYRTNIYNLDPNLGPYQYETWKKWLSLSSKVSLDILNRVCPTLKKISADSVLAVPEATSQQVSPSTALNFTHIPSKSYPQDSSPSTITKYSIDTSYTLGQMLSSWEKPVQLLGELQISFLCFLVGQVYQAFEQWKNLLRVFCFADEIILKESSVYMELIGDLYFQIKEVPSDMFVDIVSCENFLTQSLRVLFENVLGNESMNVNLRKRTLKLKQYVTEKFQWDFDCEPYDEAPVVME
nr:EOG090X0AVR [Megafenestra aurita]